MDHDILFQPVNIGGCRIRNRFAMAPLGPLGLSDPEGGWSQRGIEYYTARARGGTGLIHTGITFVENDIERHAVGNCPCSTHNPTHFIRTSRELCDRVHAYGSRVFLQMTGGFGRVTIPKAAGLYPPVAPSPIQHRWKDVSCRPLTVEEIHTLVRKFGEGAFYAKSAGYDGVQIHAVHEGYLLDQFTIALFNQREDEYGGSLENRLRIVKEIAEEIHTRCGEDFPVSVRYSPKSFIKDLRDGALPGEEFEEKGRDLPEGLVVARLLESYGYAALDVDVGSYDSWWWSHPPMYQEKGLYIPYARAVKEAVSIPVICAGRMDDPDMAASAVLSGACDIVSLGRPLLADPDYVRKLQTGNREHIRPCLSCQEGCMGRIGKYSSLACAVNPACCRESDMQLFPATEKKRVLIVGGGPAGCETARVLALRGHTPILVDSGDKLGGKLLPGGVPDFKEDDRALADWYAKELKRLDVAVRLNTRADENTPREVNADAVVVATGGKPRALPAFEDAGMVVTAEDALLGLRTPGRNVVMVGGGTVACETALWLRENGSEVTMVVRAGDILANNGPSCHANYDMLKKLVYFKGVRVIPNSHVTAAAGGVVTVAGLNGEMRLPAEQLIMATGYEPEPWLYNELTDRGLETYLVGDANRVANIMYAIWDAYEVARYI